MTILTAQVNLMVPNINAKKLHILVAEGAFVFGCITLAILPIDRFCFSHLSLFPSCVSLFSHFSQSQRDLGCEVLP